MAIAKRLLLLVVCICVALNFYGQPYASAEVVRTGIPPKELPDGQLMEGVTAEQEREIQENKESFVFQAEVNRLMDIIINSLYKNREVFLRELISNASDALDKLRFLIVGNPEALGETKELKVEIFANWDLKTLTIRDTGIGMTRNDLVNNLGTLAKSGTKKFVEALSEGADMGLIGQFGVGFYSVYLIADKVRVVSKHNDDDQYIWESTADSAFTVAKDPRGNTLGRGTEITMWLKKDAHEFVEQHRLEEVVKRHSEFITFPITLYKKFEENVEVKPKTKEQKREEYEAKKAAEGKTDSEDLEVEEEFEDDDMDEKPKQEKVERWEWVKLNGDVAIWSREKDDITADEYQKFYQVIAKDTTNTASNWIHFKAEGDVEFRSIMYIPSEALGLYDDYNSKKAGMRLYVKKVLIQDDFEELLPRYLNFIKGVVDSSDLPLNVSRETLQQHKILKVMGKKLTRKVLEMLKKLASTGKVEGGENIEDEDGKEIAKDDPEHPYMKFWAQFGKSIKMGIMEDAQNRSKLAKLLRYKTSLSEEKFVSLEDYIANKPDWQKDIYYIAAESLDVAKKSPFLEVARKKNIEVLLLDDPVDEYCIQNLGDFDGLKLVSLTKEGVKFGDEDEQVVKKRSKLYRDQFKPLTKYLKSTLAGKVAKVTVSQRVEESPSVIVTSQYGHSANMERIVRSQTFANPEAYKAMQAMKTLELNPRHPIIVHLLDLVKNEPDAQQTKDLSFLLYDTALLTSGFHHDDTEDFAGRMYRTLALNLKLDSLDLEEEIQIEEEEEEEPQEEVNIDNGSEKHDEF